MPRSSSIFAEGALSKSFSADDLDAIGRQFAHFWVPEPRKPARGASADRFATLEEFSAALGGIGREMVRQIEQSALKKLRLLMEEHGLHLSDFVDRRRNRQLVPSFPLATAVRSTSHDGTWQGLVDAA